MEPLTEPISRTRVFAALQGLQQENPRLYDVLREMARAIDFISLEVSARGLAQAREQEEEVEEEVVISILDNELKYVLHKRYIELFWDPVPGRTFLVKQGDDEATADTLYTTSNNVVQLDAANYSRGDYTFYLSFAEDGNEECISTTLLDIGLVRAVELTDIQEFKNTIILSWDTPESDFEIDYYDIRVGTMRLARVRSNSYLYLSNIELSGQLAIRAVDIAGNRGPETLITIRLSEPNNFFKIAGLFDSDLLGPRVNGYVFGDEGLYIPADNEESYDTPDIADETMSEVGGDFPYWLQPSANTAGSYTADFDFEEVYQAVYINIIISCLDLDEDYPHTMTRVIKYKSALADEYTTLDETTGVFVESVRYVQVKAVVEPDPTLRSICLLRSIQAILSLSFAEDSGETVIVSGAGQNVSYTVNFRIAPHVVVTVNTQQDYQAACNIC